MMVCYIGNGFLCFIGNGFLFICLVNLGDCTIKILGSFSSLIQYLVNLK